MTTTATHWTALSKPCGISSTPRRGTKPLKHSTGLTISRAKPFPCFCTSYGGLPLNAAFAGRLGISALDDDGRGHPCGARVYGFCIPSKQERAGQRRVGPGPGIHPNGTAKGYAGIRVRIGGRAGSGRRRGNDGGATSALDRGAGQKAPSARPECEQRRHYCRGSKPDHFCGTSQGKHTEASIEKDCQASQTDLIRRLVGVGAKGEAREDIVFDGLVLQGRQTFAGTRE